MVNGPERFPTDFEPLTPPGFFPVEEALRDALDAVDAAARWSGAAYRRKPIGYSREGRPLWGLELGSGERRVSLTAGAHADEPVGPATALALARWLAESPDAAGWVETHRFVICPQVNPDGTERNRGWFADPPDARTYLRRAVREAPGDDIEFGYPRRAGAFGEVGDERLGSALPALRPENAAVAKFLAGHAPFVCHASLHGMGFSEGAWFLINARWAGRAGPLMDALTERVEREGWGWHDIDRRGEKGFHRIRRGFSTTPDHASMRDFFERKGDPATAALFHPCSMEYVASLGGDPLTLVSELPLFLLRVPHPWSDPPGEATPYLRFRDRVPGGLAQDAGGRPDALDALLREFQVEPAPLQAQVRLQTALVLEALRFLMER